MSFSMAEELTLPKSHLELSKILKDNKNCLENTQYQGESFEIYCQRREHLESILLRVRENIKEAKRSLDCLEGEWWHLNISMEPKLKRNRISNPLSSLQMKMKK